MSTYEWERGDVTLPASQWPKFRKALISWWNEDQEEKLEGAKAAWSLIKAAQKGKRGKKARNDAALAAVAKFCEGSIDEYERFSVPDYFRQERTSKLHESFEWLRNFFWNYDHATGEWTLRTKGPMKKEFDFRPVSKDARFSADSGGVYITLTNETRTLHYRVDENNHACDRARETPLVSKMFQLLGQVKWGRKSGGHFYGNNEYNRDPDNGAGGGGNYITSAFGPLGEQARKDLQRW